MSAATEVGDILEAYARRGVFRGFSRDQGRGGKGLFRLLWHRDQVFQLAFDNRRQRLRIACVIPAVPAASPMYRDLKAWLKGRQDAALPDHRRCDPDKVSLRTYNRGGSVALTLTVLEDQGRTLERGEDIRPSPRLQLSDARIDHLPVRRRSERMKDPRLRGEGHETEPIPLV